MNDNDFAYGPLTGQIGTSTSDKGTDIAPEPDGTENNPYYETITYTAIGDVEDAEEELLKSNDKVSDRLLDVRCQGGHCHAFAGDPAGGCGNGGRHPVQ